MKFTTIIIGLFTFLCFSFTAQAKSAAAQTYHMGSAASQHQQIQLAHYRSYRHSHRRDRQRLFWITAGAVTAAAIAAGANRHGRVRECRVWYRGRYRYGYKRPGEPCYVNYRGRTYGFDHYEVLR